VREQIYHGVAYVRPDSAETSIFEVQVVLPLKKSKDLIIKLKWLNQVTDAERIKPSKLAARASYMF